MSYETFKKEVLEKHNHTKSIVRYGVPRIKKDDQDMYKFIGGCTHNKEDFEDYARKLYHETGIRFVLVKTWKPHFLFWKRRYFYFLASHPFKSPHKQKEPHQMVWFFFLVRYGLEPI